MTSCGEFDQHSPGSGFQGSNHLLSFFSEINLDVVEAERIELNSCQRQDVVGYTFLHQTALIYT